MLRTLPQILIFLVFTTLIFSNQSFATQIQYNQNDQAIRDANSVLQNKPKDLKALIKRGHAYWSLGKYDLALQDYQKVLKIRPNDRIAAYAVVKILVAKGDTQQARQKAARLLAKYPRNTHVWYLQGLVEESDHRLSKAQKWYQKVLAKNSHHTQSLSHLVAIYRHQRKFKQAVELMKQHRDDYSDTADYYIHMGLLYEDAHKDQQAKKYYQKAEKLASNRPDIQARLLSIYNKHISTNHSVLQFEREIAIDKRDFGGYTGLGQIYAWKNHLDESEKLYKKALQTSPQNPDLLVALAKIYEQQNRYKRAQAILDKAARLNPQNKTVADATNNFKKIYSPEFDFQFSFDQATEKPQVDETFVKTTTKDYAYQINFFKRINHSYAIGAQFDHVISTSQTGTNALKDYKINQLQFTLLGEFHFEDKWYIRPAISYVTATNFGTSLTPLTSRNNMVGGYLFLTKQWQHNALTVWYSRDPEIIEPGANHKISPQNTWAISNEYFFNDHVSLRVGGSLFLTEDDNRYAMVSINPRYRFSTIKNLSVEYELDYIQDDPRTFLNNFILRYSRQLFSILNFEMTYQLTQNSQENSYLNSLIAFLSFDISNHVRLDIEGSYGIEAGDDHDTSLGTTATLVVNFF